MAVRKSKKSAASKAPVSKAPVSKAPASTQEIQGNYDASLETPEAQLACYNCHKKRPCLLEDGSKKCHYCKDKNINCNVNDHIPDFKLQATATAYQQLRAAANANRPINSPSTLDQPWKPAKTTFPNMSGTSSKPSKRKKGPFDVDLDDLEEQIKEIDQAIESLEAKKAELEKIFEARKALEALKK